MKSGVWKGVGAGLIVFFLLASVAYLTALRVPVLKVLGHEYAALQLRQSPGVETVRSSVPAAPASPAYGSATGSKERFGVWHKRHATISVFGFMEWLIDLWPWLLGLGLGLPVLGGLVAAQISGQNGSRSTAQTAAPLTVATHRRGRGSPPEGDATPPPASAPQPPDVAPVPPSPPEEWSWNAKPVARTTPARPKPPAVKSPNGDSP